ncbi:MAG TPA: hypothetical protein DEG70_07910 [Chloroflexi bacterium]|jgi:hypothetical protein|nr:hypothetical protein [Chloroflexota bacterium]
MGASGRRMNEARMGNLPMMDEYEQITIRLAHMINYLSKRVTPQRDMSRVDRAPERGEWSVRQIVAHLRDTEARVYPKLFAIANYDFPDLRELPPPIVTTDNQEISIFTVMSQFRRLRQSTLSLLRALPDDAWIRAGTDIDNRTVTIRDLALSLQTHDAEHLAQIDQTLIARDALPHHVTPLVLS